MRFILALALPLALNVSVAHSAEKIIVGGTGSPLGSVQMLADAYRAENPDVEITVLPSLGSGGGIKALTAGKIQLALSARPLKDEEAADGLTAAPFARTPIVFATQAANPATGISLEWVAGAYDGTRATWPDGSRVRLILRPEYDSDSVVLSEVSPVLAAAFAAAQRRPGLIVASDAQEAADALEKLAGSLGTSTLTQVLSEGRAIKPLELDGRMPGAAALADGSYPYSKDFYLVTGPATSESARAFVAFIRSDAGKAVLVASGNLPLD